MIQPTLFDISVFFFFFFTTSYLWLERIFIINRWCKRKNKLPIILVSYLRIILFLGVISKNIVPGLFIGYYLSNIFISFGDLSKYHQTSKLVYFLEVGWVYYLISYNNIEFICLINELFNEIYTRLNWRYNYYLLCSILYSLIILYNFYMKFYFIGMINIIFLYQDIKFRKLLNKY